MDTRAIRLFLVHEVQLMCNVLTAALEGEEDIIVVGSANSVEEAIEKVDRIDADVILTSTHLPRQGALKLTEKITEENPNADVVVLGITEQRDRVLQFIEAGAAGYVLKDDSVDDLLETIRTVYEGKALVSPRIASAMMDRISELAQLFSSIERGVTETAGLTSRELDVLTLLGKNMTNQEIADHLVIEVGTVKNHVHSILNKLNVSSRDEAAAYLALIRNQSQE
jgi:DNA-binding NarL/FixJ family response regulator